MPSLRRKQLLYGRLCLLQAIGYRYADVVDIASSSTTPQTVPTSFATLHDLHAQVRRCHLCDLSKQRHHAVAGLGEHGAEVMFIGDFPGVIEDETGKPFAGRSGEMLEKMIRNVLGLDPAQCYLTYAVKCHAHRATDKNDYVKACQGFLREEVRLVAPKSIVILGEDTYRMLTGDTERFEAVRGVVLRWEGVMAIPTHSPSFLLRNPSRKKETLQDLQRLKALL